MKLIMLEFKTWLQSKESNCIIGKAGRSRHCPLATYLNEVEPKHTHVVAITGYYTYKGKSGEQRSYDDLPYWARAFRYAIDSGSSGYDDIYAKNALSLLK